MSYPAMCPEPVERAVMVQQWLEVSLLHWPVAIDTLASSLPAGIRPDLYDGQAWLGLVPFSMRNIRLPWSPPFPWLSSFPETNVRTYVTGPEGPGIYFYSLDVTRLLPALVARLTYRLPYMWARLSVDRSPGRIRYEGVRRWPRPAGASNRITIAIGDRVDPESITPREHFFTARWGLYSRLKRGLSYAPVDHEPWPLHRAEAIEADETLIAAAGFVRPDVTPIVHYSPGVSVRIGVPRLLT